MPSMTSTSVQASSAALAFGHSRIARVGAAALRLGDRLVPELAARLAVDLFFTPLPTKLSTRKGVPPTWQQERHANDQESFTLLRRVPSARAVPPRTPVLLVHGWAGEALQMLPLAKTLETAGFEPVLMDLPAHGRSDGWRCTMPQIVRSLFRAQAVLGSLHAVVAHSMGAVASLHAMAHGLPVPRLVALAPSAAPESVLQWFGDAFGLPKPMLRRMRQRIVAREGMLLEQFEPAWLGNRVAAPVMLIHDRGDRMASFANSEALARALPDSRLFATEGLSHRRVLADAAVLQLVMAHMADSSNTAGIVVP